MADVISVADEVVSAINNGTWAVDFEAAERRYLPIYDLEQLRDVVRVVVLPRTEDVTQISRASSSLKVGVLIGIETAYETEDNTTIDPLMALAAAMRDFFQSKTLSSGARCNDVGRTPLYDQRLMQDHRIFMAVVTLEFLALP